MFALFGVLIIFFSFNGKILVIFKECELIILANNGKIRYTNLNIFY